MVTHTHNPSYLESRDQEIEVQVSSGKMSVSPSINH
jgi:hypothetical protein